MHKHLRGPHEMLWGRAASVFLRAWILAGDHGERKVHFQKQSEGVLVMRMRWLMVPDAGYVLRLRVCVPCCRLNHFHVTSGFSIVLYS